MFVGNAEKGRYARWVALEAVHLFTRNVISFGVIKTVSPRRLEFTGFFFESRIRRGWWSRG